MGRRRKKQNEPESKPARTPVPWRAILGCVAALIVIVVMFDRLRPPWQADDWEMHDRQDAYPSNDRQDAKKNGPFATDQRPLEHVALAALAPSRFLNAASGATYVGSERCAECHANEWRSYLETSHSRALAEIDAPAEPPDTEFTHDKSARTYQVYRRDGKLWHRELKRGGAEEIVLADFPMKYVIGSGHHSRSYLVEDGGILIESPVTWYASRQGWHMSPGYDRPTHAAFERMADVGCLYCHAGRVTADASTRYRVALDEMSIGCERCHGPGSLHAERHANALDGVRGPGGTNEKSKSDEPDLTIVNPIHLTREERETICSLCHLRGSATVAVRHRRPHDFRPTQRLTDFRVDYQLRQPGQAMKVVGHVEQMRLSRCYQASQTLTCTTCHDPHFMPREAERDSYFQQKCLSCHEPQQCGLPVEERRKQDEADRCVTCHMPKTGTDIPHFAFTHHRVGIHDGNADTAAASDVEAGELVPMSDLSHLSSIDQDRCLGLAYMEWGDKQARSPHWSEYRRRAQELLLRVRSTDARDADVEEALSRIAWEHGDYAAATQFGESALALGDSSSGTPVNALFTLADSHARLGKAAVAAEYLEQLTRSRRMSEDWVLLGQCRLSLRDAPGAAEALERAQQIAAGRPDIAGMLSQIHMQLGDREKQLSQERRMRVLTGPSRNVPREPK